MRFDLDAARDDRLTAHFSEDFSGYTGGGDVLVKDKDAWLKITRQDFSQVPGRIRIEVLDLSMQDINWKIVHSGISIPYHLVRAGEVYPVEGLHERNRELESLVEERTRALEEANTQLEILSNTDGLTGIANRRSFDSTLSQEWSRAQRTNTPLALVMLDVDLFKHFNDEYGHVAGDCCLQSVGHALAQIARRGGDLVARYGGEEFVVLLPAMSGPDALEAARQVQREVWSLAVPHARTGPGIVTVCLGVASLVPSKERVPEDLVRQADSALYKAKQSGRNCVRLATD